VVNLGKKEQEMLNEFLASLEKLDSKLDVISSTESIITSSSSQLVAVENGVSKLEKNIKRYLSEFANLLRNISSERGFLETQVSSVSQARSEIFNFLEQIDAPNLKISLEQMIELFRERFEMIKNHEARVRQFLESIFRPAFGV